MSAVRRQSSAGGGVDEVGAIAVLAGETIAAALRPPFTYGHELVAQVNFVIRTAWLPLVLTAFAPAFGPAGVQAAGFYQLFGALDRLGGLFAVAVVREFGPVVCSIVIAGVAGTAMCADLGARKIREELDALAVLGADVIKTLVVPRFLALGLMTVIFNYWNTMISLLGQMVADMTVWHETAAGYVSTFSSNFTIAEVVFNGLKVLSFGFIIAIVCCYK